MRGRRRERLRVESRVHDTNLRSVGEQTRCQVGPTILFERPAQIPRSVLRSFSLWTTPASLSRLRCQKMAIVEIILIVRSPTLLDNTSYCPGQWSQILGRVMMTDE